jgi:D-alanyl-D-alanine dipeptidase
MKRAINLAGRKQGTWAGGHTRHTTRAPGLSRTLGTTCLLLLACATAIPANRYGLHVVPDRATYERLARRDPDKRLVDLASLGIPLDIRYATPNNFMKQPLYPVAKAYLRAPAARALAEVNRELAARGLGLKVFDGYRPYAITEKMWEPIRNPDFVADPAKGSRHNRGAAVDLTLVDLRTGAELPMPTPYDDFTSRARQDFNDLPADVLANRALLRDVMTKHGFDPLPSEWWHFDFRGWERFELMDVPLDALP